MSAIRAEREAAVRRYADYATRRKALEAVLVEMDAGSWQGEGITADELAQVHVASFTAARAVVKAWCDEALAQQNLALEEMEGVQTAAMMTD